MDVSEANFLVSEANLIVSEASKLSAHRALNSSIYRLHK